MGPFQMPMWLAAALLAAPVAAPPPPSPAPQPGAPGVYRSGVDAAAALKASLAKSPTLGISPVVVTDQYTVLEVVRTTGGPAAVHPGWAELHFVLAGSGVFVTGGRIVADPDGSNPRVEGGVARRVAAGDAVLVPPDSPHQYTEADAMRCVEVRFPAPPKPK